MTAEGTAPPSSRQQQAPARGRRSRLLSGDFVISTVMLMVFVAALIGAREWPFESKLFPIMIASTGVVLALLKMGLTLWGRQSGPKVEALKVGQVELADEDEEADQALEYVFERASRAEWTRALGWVAGFFVALVLVGALASILVFTVLYLRLEAKSTLVVAVVYAAVLAGLLYATREILNITLPPGVLLS